MDFLELHPELMPELKTWKSAKVKAPAQPSFSSENLIKAAPLLLRPFALVSISLLTLALAWFGISLVPATSLYVKAEIDAGIIDIGIEDTDIYVNQLLALSNNKLTLSSSGPKINSKKAFIKKSKVYSKENISKVYIKTIDRNEISSFETKVKTALKTVNNIESIEIQNWETQETTFAANNQLAIKANDLDKIADYLNHKDEFSNENFSSEIIAINRKQSSNSAISSNSSLKKTIRKTIRKIKQMADYPIALQNTKNPYLHVPMMTGYKANFAMVGTAPGNRIQATSRAQWLDESNSQLMNSLSWDGYIYAIRGGLGVDVNYNNYQNNELNNYSAAITYSPKFSINRKISFEPAVRFKMGVVNLDQQSNSIGNSIELERRNIIPLFVDEQQANGQQLWYRDIGLGFMLNTKWFYAGFNADNIGRHNNNFFSADLEKEHRADVHYTAIFGTEYASKTRELGLSGYGLYQKHGDLEEFWLGANFRYEWMQIGIAASSNMDVAASLGAIFNKFSFHYNIDYTKSQLLDKQFLSHQVTMRILLKPSRYASKFLKL